MITKRIKCVICYESLYLIFERKKYPITASPSLNSYKEDHFLDQTFYKCRNCSCMQLGNLINPEYLYESSHNNTSHTPTWKEHHKLFADFITNEHSILEIGGSGILYNLLKTNNPEIKYSCLDMCDPSEFIDGITYYKGNCETFTYPDATLVMSHVFEHLFNPREFIENINKSNVKSIYISIPNMMKLIELEVSNILHNEHTFYIDKLLLEWLFSQYGYSLLNYYEFKNHSLFFHFQKQEKADIKIPLINRPEIIEKIHKIFLNDSLRLENIIIKPNSFIIPAGLFGQFIVYSCKPENIIGFLDNDTMKHNKRVYGTSYYVYPFDEIMNHENIIIYILAGPYKDEIIKQLNSYKKKIQIIEL